ncbi:hypothetical protein TKV_c08870 [Thermoanaerobacter kivui]|uniref:Bacterial Pleckstrin homology domain-containing protein n=1 Tax=Thermoanaerobacter kivui TaxID=2325 RepID=A0A097AQK3_THEKI|nr:hypothetical protein [Thermoanaerobacter kivui]AIS52067.1 hypothetical protein TKV_c08870 [Thermoanaerobacter kivui]
MRYRALGIKAKVFLCFIVLSICALFLISFFNIFIDVNKKGISVFDTVFEWFIYVVLVTIVSGFLLSLVNSSHELTENQLILRLGLMGFVRLKYNDIKVVSKFEEKKLPPRGMRILGNTCYMFFEKDNLVKIQLKGKVRVYYLLFLKRYIDTIVFSAEKREEFIEELKSRI